MRKTLLAALFLCGCSAVHNVLYPESIEPEPKPVTKVEEKRLERIVSSQFEWAVQNYEAGAYEKAISQFKRLQSQGSNVPSFELIPYYLGMSYFRLGRDKEGVPQLEAFLKKSGPVGEQQDARVSLILAYERLQQWDKVVALAAESNKQNLFQENRALVYLVWARALREKGELQGAQAALKEGEQLMQSSSSEPRINSDPNLDLQGRLQFTASHLQTEECQRTQPKEVKSGKKSVKRLYRAWLESESECIRKSLGSATELVRLDSPWTAPALQSVDTALVRFTDKIRAFMTQEKSRLDQKRELERGARQELYRLLGAVDDSVKNLKNQSITTDPLELLRKRLDALLVSLSLPSSDR